MFAVKGGRFITHLKRLRDVETPLANFFASGVLELGPALGPVLWQLPERLTFDADVLDGFLGLLPRTTREAATLAARHDDKVPEDRAVTTTERDGPVRHALEFRSPTFADEAAYELLRRHGVACVVADTAGRWPKVLEVTSDLVYVRLHGDRELYASGYSAEPWTSGRRAAGAGGTRARRLRLLRQRREGTRTARRGRPARAVVVTVSPPRAGCRPSWRSTSPGGS